MLPDIIIKIVTVINLTRTTSDLFMNLLQIQGLNLRQNTLRLEQNPSYFLERKILHFCYKFTEDCFGGSNWQNVKINSVDNLALDRCQAVWFATYSDQPDLRCDMVSQGFNDCIHLFEEGCLKRGTDLTPRPWPDTEVIWTTGNAWCDNSCYCIFYNGSGSKWWINKASAVYSKHLTTNMYVPMCW